MTPNVSISTCLRKYVTFSGRASRTEASWFNLLLLIVGTTWITFDVLVSESIGGLLLLFIFLVLPAHLSSMWRRLHDIGLLATLGALPTLLIMLPFVSFLALSIWLNNPYFTEEYSRVAGYAGFQEFLGRNQIFLTLTAILIVGGICAKHGQSSDNKYGPNPNEVST